MRIDVVTLFPELFEPLLRVGMVGRAVAGGALEVRLQNLREFGLGKHRSVDDTPYGGGPGMVMRVDCIVACLEALDARAPSPDSDAAGERSHRILLTPQGAPLRQPRVQALAERPWLCLICGRYEGVDERVRSYVDEEISLGDFVMSGGELAAMAVIDTCARQLPGVLGNPASLAEESHSPATGGLLEHPQYTRPEQFRGERVPEVLRSGHHGAIAAWRARQAAERTAQRRPDIARRLAEQTGEPGAEGGKRR